LVQRVLLRLRWLPPVASSLAQHLRFTGGKLPLPSLTQAHVPDQPSGQGQRFLFGIV